MSTIDHSLRAISYNLGGATEDYELLLASFFTEINEYQRENWDVIAGGGLGENLAELKQKKNELYLSLFLLQKICADSNNSDIQKQLATLYKECRGEGSSLLKAVQSLIKSNEAIQAKIEAEKIKLLDQALQSDVGLKNNFEESTKGWTEADRLQAKKAMVAGENYKGVSLFNSSEVLVRELCKNLRDTAEKNAFRHVGDADILFLQEVGDPSRSSMTSLVNNFSIIKFGKMDDGCDTTIALSKDRFTDVENYSCKIPEGSGRSQDCAICVATDKNTQKRYCFVSAHIRGFAYSATEQELKRQAQDGDVFCQNLLAELNNIERKELARGRHIDVTVIGSDVNASPEKYKERFSLFTKKDFSVQRTGSPTNVHFMDKNDKIREIDYFFTRIHKPKKSFLKRIFSSKPKDTVSISARSFTPFGFDMENNMSDHKPIEAKIIVKTQENAPRPSWFKRIFRS